MLTLTKNSVLMFCQAIGLSALFLSAGFTPPCTAQAPIPEKPLDPDSMEIVLRVSSDYLRSLAKSKVEYSFPVQRTFGEMKVTGHVDATGTTKLTILPSNERASFVISVTGVTDTTFSIDAGPASVSASSQIPFTTQMHFSFDGIDYHQSEATAQTTTSTRLEKVCSKRGGIIGKVVRKVARKVAQNNCSEINRAVDNAVNEYIVNKFEKAAVELDAKLDELSGLDETIAIVEKHFPELKSGEYHLAANEDCLLAGFGSSNASFPNLPAHKAQVEIWLRTRPIESAMIQVMFDWNIANDLLREYVPDELAEDMPEDIRVTSTDGWTILSVGKLADEQNSLAEES